MRAESRLRSFLSDKLVSMLRSLALLKSHVWASWPAWSGRWASWRCCCVQHFVTDVNKTDVLLATCPYPGNDLSMAAEGRVDPKKCEEVVAGAAEPSAAVRAVSERLADCVALVSQTVDCTAGFCATRQGRGNGGGGD